MRLLITQRVLNARGGSELFTIEMALAMKSRGHQVRVYSPVAGDGAMKLRSLGVPVVETLDDGSWRPDLIHGQHHLQAMTALVRYPEAPMLYYVHGSFPWVERPPRHGRILRYVVTCEAMLEGVETLQGIPRELCHAIGNYFDPGRFTRTRTQASRPARALLFANERFAACQLREIREACEERGIVLDTLGVNLGGVCATPETVLPDYDLVFAIGRCAIEALACGCAVIPVTPGMAASLVVPDNLAQLAASNVSPRFYGPESDLRKEWLVAQIDRYDPLKVASVTGVVRRDFTMDAAVDKLESLYQAILSEHSATPSRAPAQEWADIHAYLSWVGPEADRLWAEAGEGRRIQTALEAIASLEKQLSVARDRADHFEHLVVPAMREKGALLKARLTAAEQRRKEEAKQQRQQWKIAVDYLRRTPLRRYFLKRLQRKIGQKQPPP